ncbi:hypothetical protein AAFC00_006822 [Neodothiora populina]|uniref:ORC6 first cyclin-like domain-containing protein n=1 Tax=Neodothiora populina TaxID=2781224 RepID=A0ABR3PB92_9PEZI
MPTSPVEQALITLLPTLHPLPTPLIDLATSLLAQSRAHAATLKPEEEIARTFAVCHIACDRLTQRLGIDSGDVNVKGAPVPPRVYGKLYSYLNGALGMSTPKRASRLRDVDGSHGETMSASGGRRRTTTLNIGLGDGNENGSGSASKRTPRSAVATPGSVASGGRRSTRLPSKTVGEYTVPSVPRSATRSSRNETRKLGTPTPAHAETSSEAQNTHDLPPQAAIMAHAICDAFGVTGAEAYILSGCAAVLALRGWSPTAPGPEADSSPSMTRKRMRQSAESVETRAEENFEDEDIGRGRERRRTGLFTRAQPVVEEDPTNGAITTTTLPPLLIALGLYTIFTLRRAAVSGAQYNEARDLAISRITGLDGNRSNDESTRRNIATFLKAAHTEGWLELQWALDVQTEAQRRQDVSTTISSADNDVEMRDDGRDEISDPAQATGILDVSGTADVVEVGNDDHDRDDSDEVQIQTPKKRGRPAKTPLRRKEKHTPRPVAQDGTLDDGVLGEAGLRSGLGTMFQDAIDWLSKDRCAMYDDWERQVWQDIESLEGDGQAGTVQVS